MRPTTVLYMQQLPRYELTNMNSSMLNKIINRAWRNNNSVQQAINICSLFSNNYFLSLSYSILFLIFI